MRELHGFRLADGGWKAIAPDEAVTAALQGDEGVLTGAICRKDTPMPVNGQVYRPLLYGYPDENGIDLLWLSDDGRLLITECKRRCVDPGADLSQICQHLVAHGAQPLSSVLQLCQTRLHHQSTDAVRRLQGWFDSGVHSQWTLWDLAARGRLGLGIVYADALPPALELTPEMSVVVAAFRFSESLDAFIVDAGTIGTATTPSDTLAAISRYAEQHAALLESNRATSVRVHRSVAPVVEYYMGLPDTMPAKALVSKLLAWKLSPAAGTGKSEPNSLRLRIRNRDGKLVPFIWFHDQAKLHVEPNIRSYCADGRFGMPYEEMNQLFGKLGRLPTAEATGGGGWNFRVARFKPNDIETFLDIVKTILEAAGGDAA